MVQLVKNPPVMWKTLVWSLGWGDPLEKGNATPSSILAWRTPWTEEPGELQSMGLQRVGQDWMTRHPAHPGNVLLVSAKQAFTHLLVGGMHGWLNSPGQSPLDWQGLFWRWQSWGHGIHPPPMATAPDSLGPHVLNMYLIWWKYAYAVEP